MGWGEETREPIQPNVSDSSENDEYCTNEESGEVPPNMDEGINQAVHVSYAGLSSIRRPLRGSRRFVDDKILS